MKITRKTPTREILASIAACLAVPAFAQTDGQVAPGVEEQLSADAKQRGVRPLEEVVVTSQRREEQLQDVPISISVLSGETLDSSNQNVVDELSRVPGVAAFANPLGGTLLTVRGVASTGANFAGTSPVGYYLDSVPFGFIRQAFVPDSNAYDLERIEVLRGPQGTLYGVNAQNGVVRVLTRNANLQDFDVKLRGSSSTTKDGGENYRGDMALNVPIIEGKLGARAVVGYEKLSGWIDKPNDEDANGAELSNMRLKVNAQPTENLSMGFMVWHTKNDFDGRTLAVDNRSTSLMTPEPGLEEYDIYGFNLGYDFSNFSISSSTSYIDYQNDSTAGDLGPGRQIFSVFASEVFSEEVNVTSTADGPWRWSFGGIYRDVEDLVHQRVSVFPNPNGIKYNDYSKSYAVFGEVTRKLLDDRLELTAGVRYFEDEVTNRQRSNPFDVTGAVPLIRSTDKFDAVSPRAVLTWHWTDDLTTYASYSEGFRSGFPQSPTVKAAAPDFPAVDSDNLVNYEVGSKGSLWDGRVNFDSAVFYIEWDGVQQNITVPTATTPVAGVINSESASGVGAEFGLSIRPLAGVELGASYSWNDLTFDSNVISAGQPIFFKGDRLTNSPESTAGVFLGFDFQLGNYDGEFVSSVNYVSVRQIRGLINGASVVAEGDEIVTSRVGFSLHAPSGWSVTIFGDNLNDENGTPTPSLGVPPSIGTNRLRPRTIGLQIEYQL